MLTVSRETQEKFDVYYQLLMQWNRRINLIADAENTWQRHIADCAQLFALLPSSDAPVMDLGSGAGLPGLVLAMMGVRQMHLVESDQRKAAFLQEAARKTHTTIILHVQRIEAGNLPQCGVLTARALAPLASLLHYANPLLSPHAYCLFPKGRQWREEVAQAQKEWQFQLIAHPSATEPHAAILQISDLRKCDHGT